MATCEGSGGAGRVVRSGPSALPASHNEILNRPMPMMLCSLVAMSARGVVVGADSWGVALGLDTIVRL